jgi:ATP-dependent DNA helicase PIF1
LRNNIIEAVILTGPAKGEIAFIPRIPMITSDLPFSFKRLQFPVKVSLAITINKAQGQTFKYVGVDLRTECFSHGQLLIYLFIY